MKNSIEEDIKNAEHFIKSIKTDKEYKEENGWHGYYNKEIVELARILQHILSDYKRVLKENELLRKDIEGWKKYCEEIEEEQTEISNKNCKLEFEIEKLQKENEELKQDRNTNYQMIALAQNEMLGYIQGYEDGKKLKRSAVACAVENQQYYIIKKEIEHYKEYIEKLQKENEDLHREINQRIKLKIENEKIVDTQFIPVQKVKDKIEEYKNMLKTCNKAKDIDRIKAINERILELQELLEGRK